MSKWVRVVDGLVLEGFPHGKPTLHDTLQAQLVEVPDDVLPGYVLDEAVGEYGPRKPNLPKERAAAIVAIDGFAEVVRLRFITPGSGQALVYELKRSEAASWAIAGAAQLAEHPMIAAEAERRKINGDAVAAEWNAQAQAWIQVAAAIETARLGGKEAVVAAADVEAVAAARDAALAALNAIAPA